MATVCSWQGKTNSFAAFYFMLQLANHCFVLLNFSKTIVVLVDIACYCCYLLIHKNLSMLPYKKSRLDSKPFSTTQFCFYWPNGLAQSKAFQPVKQLTRLRKNNWASSYFIYGSRTICCKIQEKVVYIFFCILHRVQIVLLIIFTSLHVLNSTVWWSVYVGSAKKKC